MKQSSEEFLSEGSWEEEEKLQELVVQELKVGEGHQEDEVVLEWEGRVWAVKHQSEWCLKDWYPEVQKVKQEDVNPKESFEIGKVYKNLTKMNQMKWILK